MKKTTQYDLTQGSILNRMLLVAVPIMGTQLMQMLYNLTDMFWLGRLSSGAVAASGTAGLFMWLSMAFMLVGRMGSEIGVSQSLGQKNESAARKYSRNALFLSVILGVGFALVMIIFNKQLIGFFNIQEADVERDAANYLSIVSISIPVTFVSAAITGIFNGSGNSKLSFQCNFVGLVINIILDPIMIFWFGWGIYGAAIATVLAQFVVCVLFLVAFKVNKNRPFARFKFFSKWNGKIIRQIFQWCTPIVVENLLFTLLAMVVSRFVVMFGSDAMAVQRIGSQVESLSWLIGGGFGSAITAFIGQNYGAGKWERIHKGHKIGMLAMTVWGIFISLLLFFGGGFLFSLFLNEPKIIDMGRSYLSIFATCQLISCLEAVSAGMFRGMGKTVPPSIASITSNILRVPLSYFLCQTSLGLNGIWIGVTLSSVVRSAWILIWGYIMLRKQPRNDLPQEPTAIEN